MVRAEGGVVGVSGIVEGMEGKRWRVALVWMW